MANPTDLTHALAICYVAILLFKLVFGSTEIRRQKEGWKEVSKSDKQDVCILQPILSGDPSLEILLEENIINLNRASFLYLVDENDTEAIRITKKLIRLYSKRKLRSIQLGQPPDGVNPKTFKLEAGLKEVTQSAVIILDDDTLLPLTTLKRLLHALNASDVSTALPGYVMKGTIPSRLLTSFVNNNSVSTYISLLPFLHPITINGMCYAARTDYFRKLGGFSSITHHLTDDLAVAQLVTRNGGVISQCASPVLVYTQMKSWEHYVQQMHRWFVFAFLLVKVQIVNVQLGIVLLNSIHPILLWFLIVLTIVDQTNPIPLGVILIFRGSVIFLLNREVGNCQRHAVCLSIVSELLQPFHLLHALFVPTIRWRTRVYRVISNSEFREAK